MRKKSLLICGLIIIIVSCSKSNKESISSIIYDYDLTQDKTIEWNDLFNQNQDFYYVYVYSPKCSHCNDIKQDVISYSLDKDNFYFVLFDTNIPTSEFYLDCLGSKDVKDVSIAGTPSLLAIENHILIKNIAGSNAIIATLTNP